ncbi:SGNH/GDSL hydrolase family protein [Frondihabitans cladoniiphilus]|uniref:SGNH hydrolase-type esterase domain-containing protein n=1 Tax=Frondihabitans cladoniiphilus TaxID=715785 RepID=A0ABP8VKR0_9MICO
MNELVCALARPLVHSTFDYRAKSFWKIPQPDDAPQAHAPGPDPDRVLVFGNGPAGGFGVRSHDLALPGQLSRAIAARTGRGATVDFLGKASSSTADVIPYLDDHPLWRYDAVVVVIGNTDAIHLTPLPQYRDYVERIVGRLLEATPATTQIVLMEIPPVSVIPTFHGVLGFFGDRHAPQLNAIAREVAATSDRVAFAPVSMQDCQSRRHRTAQDYHVWAAEIADHLLPGLLASGSVPSTVRVLEHDFPSGRSEARIAHEEDARTAPARLRRSQAQDEEARLGALRELGVLELEALPSIQPLVDGVRAAFGTTSAAFTLIDRDFQVNKVRSGFDQLLTPRATSLCSIAIQEEGAIVVSDITTDPAFAGDGSVRFYAGYPVESPSGYRVGALCIFDGDARPSATVDPDLLATYAHAVERELWAAALQQA